MGLLEWFSSMCEIHLAYFVLLPPNLFVSIRSYWASKLKLIHSGLLVRVVSLNLVITN